MEKLTRDGKFLSREKEEEVRKEGEREQGEEEMKRERVGEREKRKRGERKTFLLPPLLATEAISILRRSEKRGEGRAQEGWRRNFPPPSSYTLVCPYAMEEKGGWGREGHHERGRREKENVEERESDWKRWREDRTDEREGEGSEREREKDREKERERERERARGA